VAWLKPQGRLGETDVPEVAINRLAPGDGRVVVDWEASDLEELGPGNSRIVVECKERGGGWAGARRLEPAPGEYSTSIAPLVNGKDYEIRVRVYPGGRPGPANRAADPTGQDTWAGVAPLAESAVRMVRPGPVPGVVVNYIHPEDYTYNSSGRSTASPSIARLPDGAYVASHDIYWQRHGQNRTLLFISRDGGATWRFLSELCPCFWGKLFVHRGRLYMLATETEYGALIIRGSDDGGMTWTEPATILPGGSHEAGGPHKAPVPVVEHEGRLWTAVEHGSWLRGAHDAGVVSAPVDADLLDPKSWSVTPFLPYDPAWPGTIRGGDKPGVLEGNIVATPSGELVNFLRYNTVGGVPDYGKAVVLNVNAKDPTAPLTFRQVVDFPGNMSKFTIYFDPVSKYYWSLVNRVTTPNVRQRNILSLVRSPDLVTWEVIEDILNYEENGWPEDNTKVGFQYVDWMFEGEDIVALSRTAINGAWNYHNANHITFHRIQNFRSRGGMRA